MTVDTPQQTPSYASPPPAYVPSSPAMPPAYSSPVQDNYSYPAYNQQQQTALIRTQRAGGTGLLSIGIVFWLISFFFLYDDGLFWTLQIISYAVCCIGSVVSYSGARRYRTYLVQTVSILQILTITIY